MIVRADVEIEIVETWPTDFHRSVAHNRELILGFQRERLRIDRLCQENVTVRINPPTNEYASEYNALVDRLDESLTQHRLVGYHCTRLTPGEIAAIRSTGLRVLTPELISQRLEQCVSGGFMKPLHRDYLFSSQSVRDSLANRHGNRTGMIWLCANRSMLQNASGVHRLFRFWGGEAVYGGHEGDQVIASVLACIGVPAIVKCAIPFPCDYPYYPKHAARFLSQFVAKEIENAAPSAAFDLSTRLDVAPSEVVEIIEFVDPQFESLTKCSAWPAHCRINGPI